MNSIKNVMAILMIVLLSFGCKENANPEVKTVEIETAAETPKEVDPNATYAKAEFTIEGMTCAMGCAKTIEKKIAKMDGVKSATVDFDRKLAMVEYNDAKVNEASLTETVGKAGDMYKVTDMKTVADFSTAKKGCSADCKGDCTAECGAKTEAEKMACTADCNKPCCAKKAKA